MMVRASAAVVMSAVLLGSSVVAKDAKQQAGEDAELPPAIPAGSYVGSVPDEIILETASSEAATTIIANRVELDVTEDGSVTGTLEWEERGKVSPPDDPLMCPGGGSELVARVDPDQRIGPALPHKLSVTLEFDLYSAYNGKITPKKVEHWCIDPVPTTFTEPHEMVIEGYAHGVLTGSVPPWSFEAIGGDPGAGDEGAGVSTPGSMADSSATEAARPKAKMLDLPRHSARQLKLGVVMLSAFVVVLVDAQAEQAKNGGPLPSGEELIARAIQYVLWLSASSAGGEASESPIAPGAGSAPAAAPASSRSFMDLPALPPGVGLVDAASSLSYDAFKGLGGPDADAPSAPLPVRPADPPRMKPAHVEQGRRWVALESPHEVRKLVRKTDPKTKEKRWTTEGRVTLETGAWYQMKERPKKDRIYFYDTDGKPIGVAIGDDKGDLHYEVRDPKKAE